MAAASITVKILDADARGFTQIRLKICVNPRASASDFAYIGYLYTLKAILTGTMAVAVKPVGVSTPELGSM